MPSNSIAFSLSARLIYVSVRMCICVCVYSLPAIFNFPISVTLIELSPLGWAESRQTATSATTALAKISSQLRLCFRPLFPAVARTAGLGDFGSAGCDCSRACVCASQWLMSVANALNSVKCITILPCLDYSCNWAPLLMLAPSISLYPAPSLFLLKQFHTNSCALPASATDWWSLRLLFSFLALSVVVCGSVRVCVYLL